MINQLRHETLSGAIDDLAHVASEDCLSDCLTKSSAKADALIKTVETSNLPNADKNPPFREMMKPHHKAWLAQWLCLNIERPYEVETFLGIEVQRSIYYVLNPDVCHYADGWEK